MDFLKITIETSESEPSPHYKLRPTDIIPRQSQRTSQLIIIIKIR